MSSGKKEAVSIMTFKTWPFVNDFRNEIKDEKVLFTLCKYCSKVEYNDFKGDASTHDPRSGYNLQRSKRSKRQRSWGSGGLEVFWDPGKNFSEQSTLTNFWGSKEHLDWFKMDLKVDEIITAQGYKHKKNVNGNAHMQC